MSKTTKIIAALGVVAGLGVAALPAFTYAAEVSGNADIYVEVDSAIAMQIVGNNDDREMYDDTKTDGPAKAYSPDGSTIIDGQSITGFDLGTALESSSSYVKMLPNELKNTKSTVSIWTNNAAGYSLDVKANTSADMTNGTDTIAAIAGTPAVGTPGWAFKVAGATGKTNVGTVQGTFANDSQMTIADQTIVSSAAKTSGGDAFDVTYDIATKNDQQTGIYHVELTYTATTNNGAGTNTPVEP